MELKRVRYKPLFGTENVRFKHLFGTEMCEVNPYMGLKL